MSKPYISKVGSPKEGFAFKHKKSGEESRPLQLLPKQPSGFIFCYLLILGWLSGGIKGKDNDAHQDCPLDSVFWRGLSSNCHP